MQYKDYYAILGVPRDAEAKQIRDAYRKLARKYHPDVNPNDKDAEAKFKEINEAYEVLSDPEKRKKYDALGEDWERVLRDEELRRQYTAAGGGPADFSDFFTAFFGGPRRPRGGIFGNFFGFGGEAAAGVDAEVEVALSLEEAAHGTIRQLDVEVEDACARCGGAGVVASESRRQGAIRIAYGAQPCSACGGSGFVPSRRSVQARIPPGATDGVRLRLSGQGGRGARGRSGGLYVRVRLLPHPVFRAEGRDLHCELPVWDFEAALGAEVDAPTLDGRVRVKIPAGSQSGRVLRVRAKGLPGQRGGPAGDLYYRLKIVVPAPVDEEERRLLTQLQQRVTRRCPDPREALLRRNR